MVRCSCTDCRVFTEPPAAFLAPSSVARTVSFWRRGTRCSGRLREGTVGESQSQPDRHQSGRGPPPPKRTTRSRGRGLVSLRSRLCPDAVNAAGWVIARDEHLTVQSCPGTVGCEGGYCAGARPT